MSTIVLRRAYAGEPGSLGLFEAGYASATSRIFQVSGSVDDLVYKFPYAPVEVSFDSVGSEYQQIDRPGDYPLIDRKQPNLLRATFEFRVAHRPSNGLQPVSRDIEYLRRMASQDKPVSIVGLGAYFDGITYLSTREQANVLFRIMDLSVKVVRRGPNNEPWQAEAQITLIEDRNPFIMTASIAAIRYDDPVPTTVSTNKSNAGNGKKSTPAPSGGGTVLVTDDTDADNPGGTGANPKIPGQNKNRGRVYQS